MSATFETGFVKCRCRNCNKNIEFDAVQAGATVSCPHCTLETVLFIPHTSASARPANPGRSSNKVWIIVGSLLVLVALVVIAVIVSGTFEQIASGAFGLLGAVVGLILFVLFLIWAVLWIIFPMFVYFGMNRMEKILRQIEENTRKP